MSDDPTIHWTQATWFGIQRDEAAGAWHSGHATDVLRLPSGTLLVATETGGVWSVNPGSVALPLADGWNNPDVNCLAAGPDNPDTHFFAGCMRGVIRETELGAKVPLLEWAEIADPLPSGAGDVRRIVVIRVLRRIVAACTGGMYWAEIPPTSQGSGCLMPFGPKAPPRPPYVWKKAGVIGTLPFGFWDVAIGATSDRTRRSDLQDPSSITIVAGAYWQGGVFVGQWTAANDLVFRRPSIAFEDGTDATYLADSMSTTSVSSCEVRPTVLYAGCARPDGRLLGILRSQDGGRSWRFCPAHIAGASDPLATVQTAAGGLGSLWANCIAASPTNPGMAALGWDDGPFLTLDGGATWKQVTEHTHLHADIHLLRFFPEIPADVHDLYVCSDGGVARIGLDDYLAGTGQPWQSDYNRELPTLQCYSTWPSRMYYGSFAASTRRPGLIATGLQDNGNVHCMLDPALTPWTDIDGGDGGWNAFLTDGALLHNIMGRPVAVTHLDATGGVVSTTIVPITQPNLPTGLVGPVGEAVVRPSYRNAAGRLLTAVAAKDNNVYGLFVHDVLAPRFQWQLVAALPAGVTVGAVASFHGASIFAGTASGGQMFVIDTQQKSVLELPVVLPQTSPSTQMQGGSFTRIVFFSDTDVFATLDLATEARVPPSVPPAPLASPITMSYLVRLDNFNWLPTAGFGLPNEPMYALEAVAVPNSRVPRALFVATDDRVYISRDDGETWQGASQGLPRRPHCSDLRVAADPHGGAKLYLSTYGRSVWVAPIGAQG